MRAYLGDYNELVYLRARHYAPGIGRFTTKDPSRLESNLYSYARSNPIRYIDPAGLFSRDEIAESLGFSSFSGVLAQASIYENWGLIATLLSALPGDSISGGKLSIGFSYLGIPTTISYGRPAKVGVDANGDITLNNLPIGNFAGFYDVNARFGNRYNYAADPGSDEANLFWRYTFSRYYKLYSPYSVRTFVDGSDTIDYPDFVGMSVSVSFPGNLGGADLFTMDRFGRTYFGVLATRGKALPIELSYFEGYVGNSKVSEGELVRALSGPALCLGVNIAVGGGVGGSGCLTSHSAAIYTSGLQAGASFNYTLFNQPISSGGNSVYAWNWALEDRYNGIRMNDLLTMPEQPYNGCNPYISYSY